LAYGISDASGWAVFLPRDIDRYMGIVEDHGDFAKATNVQPPLTTAAALISPLLDALNVSTVLADPAITATLPYPVVGTEGPVRIMQRPNALGPATLVRGVRADEAASWRHLKRSPGELATTAYVERLPRPATGGGTVRLTSSTADTQRYAVTSTGSAVLPVSGRFDAGWSARVGGRKAEVLRADGIFRAVVVPPGSH